MMRPNQFFEKNEVMVPDNVIIVNGGERGPKFYIYLAKEIFHNQKCDQVEFHGYGEDGIHVVAIVIELITRLGYAEINKIRTRHGISMGRKIAKLVVHLSKSEEFEDLYRDFKGQVEAGRRGENRVRMQTEAGGDKWAGEKVEEEVVEEEEEEGVTIPEDEPILEEVSPGEEGIIEREEETPADGNEVIASSENE